LTAGCRQPGEPKSIRLSSVFEQAKVGSQDAESTPRVPVGVHSENGCDSCPGPVPYHLTLNHKPRFYVTGNLCFHSARMNLCRLGQWWPTVHSWVRCHVRIAWYHLDVTESGATAGVQIFHTLSHRVAGYLRVIRIPVASSNVALIARSTPYRRSLNCFIVSVAPGGAT
jgi:hypothetical protein